MRLIAWRWRSTRSRPSGKEPKDVYSVTTGVRCWGGSERGLDYLGLSVHKDEGKDIGSNQSAAH